MFKDIRENRRVFFIAMGIALFILAFTVLLTWNLYRPDPAVTDVNLKAREIENTFKFIFNGYLGHFFRFKYLGNLNWLVLPFLFYFAFTFRRREQWQKALFVAYIVSLVLIGAKGFFNARYLLTLVPLTLTFLMFFVWEFLGKEKYRFLIKYVIAFLFLLVFTNDILILFFSLNDKDVSARNQKSAGFIEYRINLVKDYVVGSANGIKRAVTNLGHDIVSLPANIKNNILSLESYEEENYPVFRFLSRFRSEHLFLVNNIPSIYYYSGNKGIYYWCQDDIYYTAKGPTKLMANHKDDLNIYLRDSLNVHYVFSILSYNKYNPDFEVFLKNYCEPVFIDQADFVLYKIHEKPGSFIHEDSLKSQLKRELNDTTIHHHPGFISRF